MLTSQNSLRNMRKSPLRSLASELNNQIVLEVLTVGMLFADLYVSPHRNRNRKVPRFSFIGPDGAAYPLSALSGFISVFRQLQNSDYISWLFKLNTFEVYSTDISVFANQLPRQYLHLFTELLVEYHAYRQLDYWEPMFFDVDMLPKLSKITLL
jgi:hypothetical protein